MKILLVSLELRPEASGVGLAGPTSAQRVSGLAERLGERGHDVRIVTLLRGVSGIPVSEWRDWAQRVEVPGGMRLAVKEGRLAEVPVYAVAVTGVEPELATGAFCRGVPELLLALDWRPDLVHAFDAGTGLLPLVIRDSLHAHPFFAEMGLLFTVHDLSRQEVHPPEILDRLRIDRRVLTIEGAEYYGQVNFLKAGLAYSDAVSVPSARYAEEIQEATFGEGLEGFFRKLAAHGRLVGLADGIDYRAFDPSDAGAIAHPYTLVDRSGKARCKAALQAELGLPSESFPVVAMIGEMSDARGFDLARETLGILSHMDLQLALLGAGIPEAEATFRQAFQETRTVRGAIGWDMGHALRLLSGADMLLLPERFGPDAFWAFVAMRYGTVPVVYETGGLADAIREFHPATGEGTGFRFSRYGGEAMLAALRHALAVYRQPSAWARLVVNVMTRDWSWEAAAARYEEAYERILRAAPLLRV